MAVVVEMQNTGDPRARAEVAAVIEHSLSDRLGEWRVSIIGSRENDNWELRIGDQMDSSGQTRLSAAPASTSRTQFATYSLSCYPRGYRRSISSEPSTPLFRDKLPPLYRFDRRQVHSRLG